MDMLAKNRSVVCASGDFTDRANRDVMLQYVHCEQKFMRRILARQSRVLAGNLACKLHL